MSENSLAAFAGMVGPASQGVASRPALSSADSRRLRGIAGWSEDPDRDLVESEFASGLVQDGFNRRSDLILAGTTLRSSRRRVRLNRDPPITHRERLIKNRDRTRRRAEIAPARVRAVLLNDRQIDGSDTAVIPESHSQPPLEPGSRRT